MNIGELCNRSVVVMQPDESTVIAAELMRQHHVGAVIVVEGPSEARRPIGIITDRDIVLEVVARGRDAARVSCSQVMSSRLATARETESAEEVLHKLAVQGVRRIPVVDERGVLQGIFSSDDFTEWAQERLVELGRICQRNLQRERRERSTTES